MNKKNPFFQTKSNKERWKASRKVDFLLTIDEEYILDDCLSYYKSNTFDPETPIRVVFQNQPGIDAGGLLRHFYSAVFWRSSISNAPYIYIRNLSFRDFHSHRKDHFAQYMPRWGRFSIFDPISITMLFVETLRKQSCQ